MYWTIEYGWVWCRKIDLDFEDDELQGLEGVESMLIDWQGGFLGRTYNKVSLAGRFPR